MLRVVFPPRATAAWIVLLLGILLATTAAAEPQFQVHGYLSQGFAWTSEYPLNGIPTAGTTDWRRVAIQFRMMPTDQDQLVVQFRERRLGLSPVTEPGNETISLDWGFAQHSFGQWSLRAGVMPAPRGIYNQIRDVGVINPFWRAPYEFYTESLETVEGLQFTGNAQLGGGFGGELSLYGGECNFRDLDPTDPGQVTFARAKKMFGGQVWITSPVPGLRAGGHLATFTTSDTARMYAQVASLDGVFDRFMVRSEWRYVYGNLFKTPGIYVQGGVQLHPQVWLYGMYHHCQAKINLPGFMLPPPAEGYPPIVIPAGWTDYYDQVRDVAGSLVFKPNSNLALKFEAHHNQGYNYDVALQPFDLVPDPPYTSYAMRADEKLTTNYFIASVSIAY